MGGCQRGKTSVREAGTGLGGDGDGVMGFGWGSGVESSVMG